MTQSTLQSSRRAFLKTGAAGVMTLGVGGMAQAATTVKALRSGMRNLTLSWLAAVWPAIAQASPRLNWDARLSFWKKWPFPVVRP